MKAKRVATGAATPVDTHGHSNTVQHDDPRRSNTQQHGMDVCGRIETKVRRTSKPLVGILGDVDGRIVPVAPPPVLNWELPIADPPFGLRETHISACEHALGQQPGFGPRRNTHNESAMAEAKRHHYVPRVLLRRFSSGPEADNPPLLRLDKKSGRPSRTSVGKEAVIGHYYRIDKPTPKLPSASAEQDLARLEAEAAEAIRKLSAGVCLSIAERVHMAFFLFMLQQRTPPGPSLDDLAARAYGPGRDEGRAEASRVRSNGLRGYGREDD